MVIMMTEIFETKIEKIQKELRSLDWIKRSRDLKDKSKFFKKVKEYFGLKDEELKELIKLEDAYYGSEYHND